MTMDVNLNIMLRARELHGAISVLADGAMAWANRIEDLYFDEEDESDD
jgi:glutamate mutase epsilon subunit